MLTPAETTRVYLALGVTDMRKSINGLSSLVQEEFELDLFADSLFAFCNRKRDIVKILYWDKNGFCVWKKRLEQDRFQWPEATEDVVEINPVSLSWLLHGLDVTRAHQRLSYSAAS